MYEMEKLMGAIFLSDKAETALTTGKTVIVPRYDKSSLRINS